MGKVLLFYEDEYGKDFLKNIINTLKTQNLIKKENGFTYRPIEAFCNPKIMRRIKANELKTQYDKIILLFDGDFFPSSKKLSMEGHIDESYKNRVSLIVVDSEIEEWICISQDWKYSGKPSDYLKSKINYKKRQLPEMIKYIKIQKLLQSSSSFKELVDNLEFGE